MAGSLSLMTTSRTGAEVGIMNLDAVRNRVADFSLRVIRRLHNLQSGRLEHRNVHHQRAQVVDVDIVTNEFESTGDGQGLVVESMDAQRRRVPWATDGY